MATAGFHIKDLRTSQFAIRIGTFPFSNIGLPDFVRGRLTRIIGGSFICWLLALWKGTENSTRAVVVCYCFDLSS